MFQLNTETNLIRMTQGDTGSITYNFTGYTFGSGDRVVWTMQSRSGNTRMQKILTPSSGAAVMTFANSDTKALPAGEYKYDVAVVQNPTTSNGVITGGDIVNTWGPYELQMIESVGKI